MASAVRSNAVNRAWMSSVSIAFPARSKMLSAALTLVAAGVLTSSISLISVEEAALEAALQSSDGLRKRLALRLLVGCIELWLLQPTPESVGCVTYCTGGFFYISLGEQSYDRLVLLPMRLCAVTYHRSSPNPIRRPVSAPPLSHRLILLRSDFTCMF